MISNKLPSALLPYWKNLIDPVGWSKTTIYPIYFGISFKDISPEATFILYKLLGKFKPSEIQSILDDDFTYFHGKGLVAWKGYQEVPS